MSDLRRLQYFLAVARERNFTRAAEQLHVAQPALSRQVRLLERELGVDLLHRTTHSFELTEAGRALLERGPSVLAAFEDLWHTIRSYGSGEQGAIALAYGVSASYETAPRLVNALTERHTGLRLATEVKSVSEIVRGLADGSIDVGIVRCPPAAPDLESRSVRHEVQGVLAHRDHRLASHSSAPLSRLRAASDASPADVRSRLKLSGQRRCDRDISASSRDGLPDGLCWLALEPPATLDVSLLTRRYNRSPAVERMLDSAELIGRELGWI